MSQPEPDGQPQIYTPFSKNWAGGGGKDFRPSVVPSDAEVKEVEETITPAPKDESVQVSADSSDSKDSTEPSGSETHVPPVASTTQVNSSDAARENGKDSEQSAGEFPLPTTTSPDPETSSPSSSSETPTKNGSPVPPVPASPPAPSAPTPLK